MRRTQLQLDEVTYELLRNKAFERGVSMAELVRRALDEYLKRKPAKPIRLEDLTFIGAGRSNPGKLDPISERHDEGLLEDFGKDIQPVH